MYTHTDPVTMKCSLFFTDLIYLKAIVKKLLKSIAAAPCGAILYGSILYAQAAIQGLINISSETKMSKFLAHDPNNSCQCMTFL